MGRVECLEGITSVGCLALEQGSLDISRGGGTRLLKPKNAYRQYSENLLNRKKLVLFVERSRVLYRRRNLLRVTTYTGKALLTDTEA